MTQEDKFKAVLHSAIDNGWDNGQKYYSIQSSSGGYFVSSLMTLSEAKQICSEINNRGDQALVVLQEIPDFRSVIFDKSFARAFWGDATLTPMSISFSEKALCLTGGTVTFPGTLWQFHLQQLVLQESYIDYLYSFIKEEHAGRE